LVARSRTHRRHVQAQTLVQAGVDWARAVLSDDRRLEQRRSSRRTLGIAVAADVGGSGELAGYIEDQQGLFNLTIW